MTPIRYVSFLEAMKAYIEDDCNVIFHGINGETHVLFDAAQSERTMQNLIGVQPYTFYTFTHGTWSIVRDG